MGFDKCCSIFMIIKRNIDNVEADRQLMENSS